MHTSCPTGREAPQHWLAQLANRANSKQRSRRGAAGGVGNGEGGEGVQVANGQQFGVLYKFHEGYTNAVKRPMLMKDLL